MTSFAQPGEESEPADWTCGTCTLTNDAEARECAACGTPSAASCRLVGSTDNGGGEDGRSP